MSSPEENIMTLLKERQTPHEVIEHNPVYTNAAMAEALGVSLADTVKNIMLETTEGEIILVVLPGDQHFAVGTAWQSNWNRPGPRPTTGVMAFGAP